MTGRLDRPGADGWWDEDRMPEEIEKAIEIQAPDHLTGVFMEYAYLEELLGKRGEDWKLEYQKLLGDGTHYYDQLHIRLKNGETVDYYFRIDSFFGKNPESSFPEIELDGADNTTRTLRQLEWLVEVLRKKQRARELVRKMFPGERGPA